MDSSQTRQQINELLHEIGKLVNNVSPSSLEKDLMKQKCILLYDAINKLQGTNIPSETSPMKETPVVNQKVQELKPLIEEQVNKLKEEEIIAEVELAPVNKEIHVEQEKKPVVEPEPKPIVEIQRQNEEIDRIIEERKKQAVEPSLFQQHLMHHRNEEMHIHEKLSSVGNRDVKDRFNQKVESLKSAISLNRKIAFVNILFKENTVEYAKAIERLNTSATFDEAMRYFNELKHQYSWENGHDVVKELEQLITKRFS